MKWSRIVSRHSTAHATHLSGARAVLTLLCCLAPAAASPLLYAAQLEAEDTVGDTATTTARTQETFKARWHAWGGDHAYHITVSVSPRPTLELGQLSIWRADVVSITDPANRLQQLRAEPLCVIEAPSDWKLKSSLFNHGSDADVDFSVNDVAGVDEDTDARSRTLHRTSALLTSRGHAGANQAWFEEEADEGVRNWLYFQGQRGSRDYFGAAPELDRTAFNELQSVDPLALGEAMEHGEVRTALDGLVPLSDARGFSAAMLPAERDGVTVVDAYVPEQWAMAYLPSPKEEDPDDDA